MRGNQTSRCTSESYTFMEQMKQQSSQICNEIKEQFQKIGINKFIVGYGGDDDYGNVRFEDQELFESYLTDFNANSRLYYITGDNGEDRFAIVCGISLEGDEMLFHVVKSSETDDGTEFDGGPEVLSLDEIFSHFCDCQEFDTINMLNLYLDLLKGKLYDEDIKFEVVS